VGNEGEDNGIKMTAWQLPHQQKQGIKMISHSFSHPDMFNVIYDPKIHY